MQGRYTTDFYIIRYDILTCEGMISSHVKISMNSLLSSLSLRECSFNMTSRGGGGGGGMKILKLEA